MAVDPTRVRAVIDRIAADVDELARAQRLPASSTPQLERAWDTWQAEQYQRGEISQRPRYTDNPFRPR